MDVATRADEGVGAKPVLDPGTLDRLTTLGEAVGQDLLGQLTPLFLDDADLQVAMVDRGLASLASTGTARDVVVRSAHTLAGSSANVGAVELSRLCAALEVAAETDVGGRGELDRLRGAIGAELARVRVALLARTRSRDRGLAP